MELYRRILHERRRRPLAPARQAIENTSGVPSLFAWHRAGSMALGPKRIFAICQFLFDLGHSYLPIFV